MKKQTRFVCQSCGFETAKWLGKCQGCEGWNTLVEEVITASPVSKAGARPSATSLPSSIADISEEDQTRWLSGIDEFDRVLGGGIVPGAIMLIGGDPGIGKSTLLTQVANLFSSVIGPSLYISGEESVRQVKIRAQRLGIVSKDMMVASETELSAIIGLIDYAKPQLVVIDSIQSTYDAEMESAPASVSQVRGCATALQRLAKADSIPIFLVGHVTKEGAIAGPRVLEHLVDTVLFFEGDNQGAFRVLRAVKNRFGPTDEIGVFEMREQGLEPVENASAMLLAERPTDSPGSAVVAAMEGSRSLLAEVQALTTPTYLNNPRRVVSGVDYNRLSLVMAVLEKRLGFRLGTHDVFVNIAGGIKVVEPAVDLAALVSIASSMRDQTLEPTTVVFGEVGLGGEVRAVNHVERRLREAARMGFDKAIVPRRNLERLNGNLPINVRGVQNVAQALEACGLDSPRYSRRNGGKSGREPEEET